MHAIQALIRSGQTIPAPRFFPVLWPRVLQAVRLVAEEMHRSLAASRRYDELRTRRGGGLPLRGRESNARQVFVEFYADAATKAPYGATIEHACGLLARGVARP